MKTYKILTSLEVKDELEEIAENFDGNRRELLTTIAEYFKENKLELGVEYDDAEFRSSFTFKEKIELDKYLIKRLEETIKRFKDFVRSNSRAISNEEFFKQWNDLQYLFVDQEAYGDRSYYYNKETGKFVDDWFSIGD